MVIDIKSFLKALSDNIIKWSCIIGTLYLVPHAWYTISFVLYTIGL